MVNYEYPPLGGGAGGATCELAKAMSKTGVGVLILTSAYKEYKGLASDDGITVCRVPSGRQKKSSATPFEMALFVAAALCALPGILYKHKPDALVVFFSIPCGPVGLAAKLFANIPYVLMLRGGDVPGSEVNLERMHLLLKPLRRWVYRKASAIAANSSALRMLALRADPGFDIKIIPNGIDTEAFSPSVKRHDEEAQTVFLFAGRICLQKNIGLLIDAFCLLQKECGNTMLTIIGDGPEKRVLQKKVEESACSHMIDWVDWCDKNDMPAHIRNADCFVNPSFNEGMSNVLLEAMSCAIPVIAADNPSSREIIVHGTNGLLFIQDDPVSLKTAMARIVSGKLEALAMGNNAREYCLKNHTWRSSAEMLADLVKNGLKYEKI